MKLSWGFLAASLAFVFCAIAFQNCAGGGSGGAGESTPAVTENFVVPTPSPNPTPSPAPAAMPTCGQNTGCAAKCMIDNPFADPSTITEVCRLGGSSICSIFQTPNDAAKLQNDTCLALPADQVIANFDPSSIQPPCSQSALCTQQCATWYPFVGAQAIERQCAAGSGLGGACMQSIYSDDLMQVKYNACLSLPLNQVIP